ncbi:beclin 1 [Anaeramoeba ignava]|uniref:Beclin 1 n=1 Tax=Anaeramoeba ignava TaxID=1746090 RepID=A0A9Q0RCH8_ANAIG|nr:beclin 1 [Anaeramoeba ignava]
MSKSKSKSNSNSIENEEFFSFESISNEDSNSDSNSNSNSDENLNQNQNQNQLLQSTMFISQNQNEIKKHSKKQKDPFYHSDSETETETNSNSDSDSNLNLNENSIFIKKQNQESEELLDSIYQKVLNKNELTKEDINENYELFNQEIESQTKQIEREIEVYKKFLDSTIEINSEKENENQNQNENEDLINFNDNFSNSNSNPNPNIKQEIEEFRKELEKIQIEKNKILSKIKRTEEKKKEYDKIKKMFWENNLDFQYQKKIQEDELVSLKHKIENAKESLSEFENLNIFDIVFKLNFDNKIASINDYRFGKLSQNEVSWQEINTAWGLTTLFLFSLAKKLNYEFINYQIIPFGEKSYIQKPQKKEIKPLYKVGSRFGKSNPFEEGMVWFIECVDELGNFLKKKDSKFKFEFLIKGNYIGNKTIKDHKKYEEWTKALSYILKNLQQISNWYSNYREM